MDILQDDKLKSLLIPEDVAYIEHLLTISSSTTRGRSRTPIFVVSTWLTVLLLLIAIVIGTPDHLKVYPLCLLFSAMLIIMVKYLPKVISEYRFRWLLRRMLDRLQECRQSLRSLFKLTQETDLICKKYPSLSLNSTALRVSLGSQCQTLFDSLRDTTISLQHLVLSYRPRQLTKDNDTTSANDSDDADIANVCQLPREAFENLLTEKTPSIQQIKCLIKLIRLQESEMLRKIICLLVTCQRTDSQQCLASLRSIIKSVTKILDNVLLIIDDVRERQEMTLFLKNPLRFPTSKSAKEPVCDQISTLVDELHTYLATAYTLASQLRVEKSRTASDDQLVFLANSLREEFSSCSRIASEIYKNLSHHTPSTANGELKVDLPDTKNQHSETDIATDAEEEDMKDYEIFEGSPEENIVPPMQQNDSDWFDDCKKIGLSISLHDELKDAILRKAFEHQIREAKALGVDVSHVRQHFLNQNSNIEVTEIETEQSNGKTNETIQKQQQESSTLVNRQIDSAEKSEIMENRQNLFAFDSKPMREEEQKDLLPPFNFASILAADAVKRSKGMEINLHEECFEDAGEDVNSC